MNTTQKLAILQFERGHYQVLLEFPSKFSSGLDILDFTSKEPAELNELLIGSILGLDFHKLCRDPEVRENCSILRSVLSAKGFTWWHVCDNLTERLYAFCSSDMRINTDTLRHLDLELREIYAVYLWAVETELPPRIPEELK